MGFRVLLACCFVAGGASVVRADKNPKGLADDLRRQDQKIADARQKLQDAKRQADAARAALQKADAAHERAVERTAELRKKLLSEHDNAPPLVAARQQAEQARQRLEQLRAPILERLQADAAYQAAVGRRDRLKSELTSLPAAAAPQEREPAAKEYADSLAAVRQLEKTACDADATVRSARETLDARETKLRELIDKRDRAFDGDSRWKSAKSELEQLKREAEQAKAELAGEQRQFANAQRSLQQEEQRKRDLQQKQQNQKQPNKNKNNKRN